MSKTLEQIKQKIFDGMFPWDDIDKEKALKDTRLLDLLREACLIEAYFSLYTGKMQELFWYDLDASEIYTIEAFEAYGHYYCLRRYLNIVDYRPIEDKEIIALRKKDKDETYDDEIRELVNFMATEHFAAQFFADIAKQTKEPVLEKMLEHFSKEEVTHARFAFDLLRARFDDDQSLEKRIVEQAKNFQHIGAYALPAISNAKADNVKVIQGFNKMIEELIGRPLSDFLHE